MSYDKIGSQELVWHLFYISLIWSPTITYTFPWNNTERHFPIILGTHLPGFNIGHWNQRGVWRVSRAKWHSVSSSLAFSYLKEIIIYKKFLKQLIENTFFYLFMLFLIFFSLFPFFSVFFSWMFLFVCYVFLFHICWLLIGLICDWPDFFILMVGWFVLWVDGRTGGG